MSLRSFLPTVALVAACGGGQNHASPAPVANEPPRAPSRPTNAEMMAKIQGLEVSDELDAFMAHEGEEERMHDRCIAYLSNVDDVARCAGLSDAEHADEEAKANVVRAALLTEPDEDDQRSLAETCEQGIDRTHVALLGAGC
jgi:hypothetical protein